VSIFVPGERHKSGDAKQGAKPPEGDATVNTKMVAYCATTGFLVFNILSGGLAELAQRPENGEGMMQLGYPLYFMTILGVWKVLGTIAILAPRFPRLKEWAGIRRDCLQH
jgi:hypothetical protein